MNNLDILNCLFGEMSEFTPATHYLPLELAMISLYCDSNKEQREKILYTLTRAYRKEDERMDFDVINAFHAIETYRYFDSALFLAALKGLQNEQAN